MSNTALLIEAVEILLDVMARSDVTVIQENPVSNEEWTEAVQLAKNVLRAVRGPSLRDLAGPSSDEDIPF